MVGDGAALYSPQALWTAAHEALPVTFVVMNNREGRGFSLEAGHPNLFAPGKKPMSTLNCYMVADADGRAQPLLARYAAGSLAALVAAPPDASLTATVLALDHVLLEVPDCAALSSLKGTAGTSMCRSMRSKSGPLILAM